MIFILLQPIPAKHIHAMNKTSQIELQNGEILKVNVINLESVSGNVMYLFQYKGLINHSYVAYSAVN